LAFVYWAAAVAVAAGGRPRQRANRSLAAALDGAPKGAQPATFALGGARRKSLPSSAELSGRRPHEERRMNPSGAATFTASSWCSPASSLARLDFCSAKLAALVYIIVH